jgi:hypothetical protein
MDPQPRHQDVKDTEVTAIHPGDRCIGKRTFNGRGP